MAEPRFRITNARTGRVLGDRIEIADTVVARTRGLLGRPSLGPGEGVWIEPCQSIHMFFMRFAIDAVFTDVERNVVRVIRSLRPWRVALGGWSARAVLELPPGTIDLSGTAPGDRLEVAPRKP